MATVSDITDIPLSGLLHIDALLDTGPDWNYLTGSNNTIRYTFSVTSGNEDPEFAQKNFTGTQQAFTADQQKWVRQLLQDGGELNKLTGIHFVESGNGTDADIHLCNVDLQVSNVTGLCSWHSNYSYSGTQLVSYDVDAYVYLDNAEWFSQNRNLTPGGYGYETLLHELGHALGLKHPFDDSINLPASQDNTSNTLMSYKSTGGAHSHYSQYDIAALKWLYGMDGLRGDLGINSTNGARYIAGTSGADTLTGTAANDKLEGDGGNDMINGGSGTDTAVFRGVRSNYSFTPLDNGDLVVTSKDGTDGTDTLRSVEILQFDGGVSVSRDDVVSAATAVSDKLTLMVMMNEYGYTTPYGSTPRVTGKAELGTTVKIFSAADNHEVGSATVNKYGLYTADLSTFADGVNKVYATEIDAAGNVVLTTAAVSFKVDITPPVIPTYSSVIQPTGGNQVHLSGTAEAGTTIELVRGGSLQTIAHTTAGFDGTWALDTSPLPNGDYSVSVQSFDQAGNRTSSLGRPSWSVNSTANMTGTSDPDVLRPGVGNNAVDGGAGIDTAVYAGGRAGFTVKQADWGFDVTDNGGSNGHDALINVERVQFDDAYVAIDKASAQLFRLYSAAYGRSPDAITSDTVGMGYWISRMDHGTDIKQVSREFMVGGDGTGQAEFVRMYGSNPSDTDFVTQLYKNVLGRAPDAEGYDFWMNAMLSVPESNKLAMRAQIMIDFSDSPENIAKVVGQLEHGVDYTPYHGV
jgi:hypothetical protein